MAPRGGRARGRIRAARGADHRAGEEVEGAITGRPPPGLPGSVTAFSPSQITIGPGQSPAMASLPSNDTATFVSSASLGGITSALAFKWRRWRVSFALPTPSRPRSGRSGAHVDPIGGCLRSFFHNDAIPHIDVRKFRVGLLKRKELTEGGPNIDVRNPFSSGKSLSRSPPEALLYVAGGRRASGEKACRAVSGWSGGSWRDEESWRTL